ncbi:MAG: hypothetical protein R2862_03690 [Thermoanaerobaculia bacterium]
MSSDYQYFLSTPRAVSTPERTCASTPPESSTTTRSSSTASSPATSTPGPFHDLPRHSAGRLHPGAVDFADDAVDLSSGILDLDENCVVAPVTLPHDAEISAMTTYLRDGDASRNLTMRLRRKRGTTSAVIEARLDDDLRLVFGPADRCRLSAGVRRQRQLPHYVDACLPGGASAGSFAIHGVKISYTRP